MGEGFVVMQSNDVDIYYYQDEPGLWMWIVFVSFVFLHSFILSVIASVVIVLHEHILPYTASNKQVALCD